MADVTLGLASGPGESTVLSVKLQMPAWELNLRATPEELAGLRTIRGSDWAARRSLHIGQSAGSPVHWAMAEAGTAAVMVGADDETWDFAVMGRSRASTGSSPGWQPANGDRLTGGCAATGNAPTAGGW